MQMLEKLKNIVKKSPKLTSFLKRLLMELTPFAFVASYIVFPVKKFIRLHIYCPVKYRKIEKLKNLHEGQRCFILATGPSLKIEDVDMLKGEYTIGINTIYKMFEKLDWNPSYFVMTDPVLFQKICKANNVKVGLFAERYSIVNALNRKIVDDDRKVIFVNKCWLDHVYNFGKSNKFKFDDNPVGGVYDYYSVTQECIYYAMYMGFKDIYLLGADNDYLGSVQHFEEVEGEEHVSYERALNAQRGNDWAYAYLKMIAEKRGVNIFNATRGGKVEVFPRVDLEKVLECDVLKTTEC